MKNKNAYKITLTPVELKNANNRQQEVLQQVKQKFGYIPNLQKNMSNYPALQETYLFAANAFRKESGFSLAEIEVIFLAISFENNCDYCVAAHSLMGQMKAKIPSQIIDELREGKELSDVKLNALRNFTIHMLLSRGWPTPEETQKFLAVGYTEAHILAVIHAISIKTLSNYVNHIFETPLDKPLKAWEWKPFRKVVAFFRR